MCDYFNVFPSFSFYMKEVSHLYIQIRTQSFKHELIYSMYECAYNLCPDLGPDLCIAFM